MNVKLWMIGLVAGALAWQTVQASSISTRVRVLENKVSQFERQVKQERTQQQAQLVQVQKNTKAIEQLQLELDDLQSPQKDAKGKGVHYLSDKRFTDSRYSYP
jgi:outer membrane murein-binding lipoprotein Lpp